MNTKEKYLDKIQEMPNKEKLKKYLNGTLILVLILIPLNFVYYYNAFLEITMPKTSKVFLLILLTIFLLSSIIIKVVLKTHPMIIFPYMFISFLIYSLNTYYFCCKYIYCFFESPLNMFMIFFSFILCVILSTLFIKLIIHKATKNNIVKKSINNKVLTSFISLSVVLGMLSSKNVDTKFIGFFILVMFYIIMLVTIELGFRCFFIFIKK